MEHVDGHTLVFAERGRFHPDGGAALAFRNVFRWRREGGRIHLAHLRHGPDRPVALFTLAPRDALTWASESDHRCGDDRYRAQMGLEEGGIRVRWRILGPSKDETLDYRYG